MKKSRGDFRLRKDISKRCYTISMIMTFVVKKAQRGGKNKEKSRTEIKEDKI